MDAREHAFAIQATGRRKSYPHCQTALIVSASLTGDAALLEALLAATVRAADNAGRHCRRRRTLACGGGAPGGAAAGRRASQTRHCGTRAPRAGPLTPGRKARTR